MGSFISIDKTSFPLYIIPRRPISPQASPRTDVLDIATWCAEGIDATESGWDVEVCKSLVADSNSATPTKGIWKWLTDNGIIYSANVFHVEANNPGGIPEGDIKFYLNDFLHMEDDVDGDQVVDDPDDFTAGNCQDASALFDVCCSALGVEGFRRVCNPPPRTPLHPNYPFTYSPPIRKRQGIR